MTVPAGAFRVPSCRRPRPRARARPTRQDRWTIWISAALATAPLAGATAAPKAAPKSAAEIIRPGAYLSDSVELRLQDDGTFEVSELGGSRRAQGRYKIEPGKLTFSSGSGDIGKTRFPLTCELAGTFTGFVVRAGQSQCKAFDGLSFRSAN